MKKISQDSVNLTFRRNEIFSFWLGKRQLSIKSKKHVVTDSSNTICSIILPTTNDEEKYSDKMSYHKASMSDLARAIPYPMQEKNLLLLKVNQCVIDYDDFVNFEKVTPHVLGHVISGIVRVAGNSFEVIDRSLVSKVQKLDANGKPTLNTLESHAEILQSQLFWSKFRINNAEAKCASEYYWFIDFEKLTFDRSEYNKRFEQMKMNPTLYSLVDSACGQTIYQLLTNDTIKRKNKSPQTCANDAVMKSSVPDPVFKENLQAQLTSSRLTRLAFLLGKEYSLKLREESSNTFKLT